MPRMSIWSLRKSSAMRARSSRLVAVRTTPWEPRARARRRAARGSARFCFDRGLMMTPIPAIRLLPTLRRLPPRLEVSANDVDHETDVGAVVGLVIPGVAAHVKVTLVEAVDHVEAEHVLSIGLLRTAAQGAHHVARDLRRRRVAGGDDRRVAQEHERLLAGGALGEGDEESDLIRLERVGLLV